MYHGRTDFHTGGNSVEYDPADSVLKRFDQIDMILQLCETIQGSTLCPTGDAFAMPIEAMVGKYRDEFEALVQ